MKIKYKHSIAIRLSLLVLVFSLGLAVVLTALRTFDDYHAITTATEERLEEIRKSDLMSIAASLWVMDQHDIQLLLDGLLNRPTIEAVTIFKGTQLIASAGTLQSRQVILREYPIYHAYNGKQVDLGTLSISAGLDEARRNLFHSILRRLFHEMVLVLLISVFMLFIVHVIVTRRLSMIAQYVAKLNPLETRVPLVIHNRPDSKTQDELDQVVTAVNAMEKELRNSFFKLNEEIAERKRREEALREALELLALFMRHSPIYAFIKEVTPTESRVVLASDNFHDMIGIRGSDMAGKTMAELFPGEFAAKITADDWAVASAGHVMRLDEELNGRTYMTIKFPVIQKGRTLLAGYTIDITERKRAEEALQASEQRITEALEFNKSILRTSSVGILTYDATGQCVFSNEAAAEMVGTNVAGLLSQNFRQLESWKKSGLYEVAIKALDTDTEQYTEAHIVTTFGRDIWLSARFSSFQSHDEKHLLMFLSDFTERKQAEQAQERLVAMLEATPGFVGFADAKDTHLLYINQVGRKMVGIPAQEDVTRLKIDDVHPEWTNMLFRDEIIPTAIREGMWTGECAFLDRDGREIPAMMALLAHKSPNNEVERFSTVSIDITERKKAEEALQTSEARYRRITEGLTDYQYTVRVENGRAIETKQSPACEKVTGYSAEEFIADSYLWIRMVAPEDRELVKENVHRVLAGKDVPSIEHRITRKDGETIWVSDTIILFRDASGNLLSYDGVIKDITVRKRSDEQTRRSLREKEVMLKEIHHRVKNNMQVIYSLLSLQAKTIADKKVRALFEESQNRISSMALIHEKLYQSKDMAHIDFKEYLQSLVRNIAGAFKRQEVHVSVDMDSLALDVNAGIPCGLIVNELVSNSLKHAFPAGRTGEIRVGLSLTAGGTYLLTVADDGVGFPSDADFRKTSSLGLQLVNVLVGQIHGTIEMASEAGSRFVIAFPGPPAAGERTNV